MQSERTFGCPECIVNLENKVFVKPPGPCLLTIKSGGSRVISSYFDSTI